MKSCKSCGSPLIATATGRATRMFCNDDCRRAYHCEKAKEKPDRNEWYSPPEIIAAAKLVMGGIDLDPASCWHADQIVGAADYYTKSDDGLSLPWRGRVWLNPPYDKFAPKFFVKFCEEYEAGHVSMAILLLGVHHLTTRWFQRVEQFSAILCLPAGRLKFTGQLAHGNPPMHGSAILGVGVNPELFRNKFSETGIIMEMQSRRVAVAAPAPLVLVSSRE